jgi:hypothetical protein
LQGKSHESPALADGGAGVGRQEANKAQNSDSKAAAVFADKSEEGQALGRCLGHPLGVLGSRADGGSVAWRGGGSRAFSIVGGNNGANTGHDGEETKLLVER